MKENQLLENKQMREKCMGRVEVLEKVKKLILLPNTEFATTEMVANYYKVDGGVKTIESLVKYNRDEIESNGYKVYSKDNLLTLGLKLNPKRGGFDVLDELGRIVATGNNSGLALFSKRAILIVGLLLRDSVIANKIKQELGLPINLNLFLRKEMIFKKELDNAIDSVRKNIRYEHFFDENYNSRKSSGLHKKICKAINSITTYQTQYSCCNNKYRIDFYFPKLNIAIEYDEKYHENQLEKDKQREYEIMRDIYIDKYYKEYSEDQLQEWEYKNKEEMFDIEYEEKLLDHSFDMTRFIRIKEGKEMEGLAYATSMIAITSNSIINSRGMSCKYDDLL